MLSDECLRTRGVCTVFPSLRHFFLCFLISILCYSLTGDRLHEEDSAKYSYKQTDMKVEKIKLKHPSILLAIYLDNEQKSGNYYYYYFSSSGH